MDSNRLVLLIFFFTTMLFSSLFVDVRRKRQEFKLNRHIEKNYDLQIKNQEKAYWHKGFQLATGITLFILFMQLVPLI
jgi:biopolymer transport protein ExbD